MRILEIALFLGFLGATQTALGVEQLRTVDLNTPGALDALERENPRHYERVREIMSDVQYQPDSKVPRWMQARFDARDVLYQPLLLLTSLPPKRRLAFTIDNVRYQAIITLTNTNGGDALFRQAVALEKEGKGPDAVKAYMNAARSGSGKAARRLGEIYDKGLLGVAHDYSESVKWFNAA